jgi:heat shock protein HslJ
MWRVALITALVMISTACLGSDFADSVEGSWQMTSGTVDGNQIPIVDTHPISIAFDQDEVSGTASCNGYGGTYELDGSTITFRDLAMTEMACSPEETMQAEAMFATALTRVDSVSLDGELTLSGDGVEMVFDALEPVPESELTNTVWVLDGLIQGESVSSPVSETGATIEFSSDGSAQGDTGCRPFSGRYTVSGAEVIMTELAADGQECEPAMASQDSLFLTVIGDGFRVEIEEDRLTTWIPGAEGLTFVAES